MKTKNRVRYILRYERCGCDDIRIFSSYEELEKWVDQQGVFDEEFDQDPIKILSISTSLNA